MKKLYFVPFSATVRRKIQLEPALMGGRKVLLETVTGTLNGGLCKAACPDEARTVISAILEKTETGMTNLQWTGTPYEWTLVTRHKRAVELLGELRDSLRSSDKQERKIKEKVEEKIASHLAWLDKNAPSALPVD